MTELTRLDRCDRCCAAATTVAEWEWGGVLMFCTHHARKHTEGLQESGAVLTVPGEVQEEVQEPVAVS